jgi:hypothetical protein
MSPAGRLSTQLLNVVGVKLSIEINAVSADLIATDFMTWTSIARGLTRSREFHHVY